MAVWKVEDDYKMMDMWDKGVLIPVIAQCLGRTELAIKCRIFKHLDARRLLKCSS